MNEGYASLLIVIGMAVLTACGWKKELFADASGARLLVVFCLWAVLSSYTVRLGKEVTLQLSVGLFLVLALAAHRSDGADRRRLPLLAAAAMQASWFVLTAYAGRRSPYMALDAAYELALGAALLGTIADRRPLQQFAALWIGVIAGDVWDQALGGDSPIRLGRGASQDMLWLSFLLARACTVISEWTASRLLRIVSRNK